MSRTDVPEDMSSQVMAWRTGGGDEEEEEEEEEETLTDDGEPRVCGVCGDRARGYHFNALTCEGCKSFFRRVIKKSMQLRCPLLNKCTITKNSRRSCQACRFRKCLDIGMRQEMVMSEKEILERRIRMERKRTLAAASQLSPQQELLVQELLRGHRSTFDPTFSRCSGFRPMDRRANEYGGAASEPFHRMTSCLTNMWMAGLYGSPERPADHEGDKVRDGGGGAFSSLPHVADLTTYMIHEIVRFSKSLQAFRSLSIGDQICLLKGATFDLMQIRLNMVFSVKESNWKCGNITYCIDDAVRAGFQPLLLEPLLKFHHTLRKLDLQDEEYVLIQAMSLFSPDRPGVQHRGAVDEVQENLALTLKTWIDCRRTHPEKHLLYPKVIACFTEMRTMTEEYSKQILQIQDILPDAISPLIMEVISKSC